MVLHGKRRFNHHKICAVSLQKHVVSPTDTLLCVHSKVSSLDTVKYRVCE